VVVGGVEPTEQMVAGRWSQPRSGRLGMEEALLEALKRAFHLA